MKNMSGCMISCREGSNFLISILSINTPYLKSSFFRLDMRNNQIGYRLLYVNHFSLKIKTPYYTTSIADLTTAFSIKRSLCKHCFNDRYIFCTIGGDCHGRRSETVHTLKQ